MMKPVEQVTAWLFRVARNRITDLFRSKKREASSEPAVKIEDGEELQWEDLLPSPEAGPEATYARSVLLEEMDDALDELPEEQREVFVACSPASVTRSCTFASASRPSTTTLGKHEGNRHEKTSFCAGTEVRAVCCTVRHRIWLCGDEPVELADAGSFWLAFDQLLASCWDSHSQQAPFRWIPGPPWPSPVLASPHDGAVGADDPRRTREISSRDARTLRTIWPPRQRSRRLERRKMGPAASSCFGAARGSLPLRCGASFVPVFSYATAQLSLWLTDGRVRYASPTPASKDGLTAPVQEQNCLARHHTY